MWQAVADRRSPHSGRESVPRRVKPRAGCDSVYEVFAYLWWPLCDVVSASLGWYQLQVQRRGIVPPSSTKKGTGDQPWTREWELAVNLLGASVVTVTPGRPWFWRLLVFETVPLRPHRYCPPSLESALCLQFLSLRTSTSEQTITFMSIFPSLLPPQTTYGDLPPTGSMKTPFYKTGPQYSPF